MKTGFLLFLALLAGSISLSAATKDSSILSGIWKSSNKGDVYFYHFSPDSALKIVHGKDTALATYHLDTAAKPMHLDMLMLDPYSKEVLYTSPGIFEWIGPGKIRIRMSANMQDRPLSFMPKGNLETYVLVRQQP